MKVLVLTGGIATGKTTVAQTFRELGVPVIDADQIAREVVRPGTEVLQKITKRFGEEVIAQDGSLNRKKLGEIVFSDEKARRDLNEITHPVIRARIGDSLKILGEEGASLVLIEVQLIGSEAAEGESTSRDGLIVVYAPEEVQISRLMTRNGLSREEALKRIASQMPIEEKKDLADYLIDNSGDLAEARRQTEELYRRLAPDPP